MFTMLLSNAEGRAFLEDSKLLKEIAFNLDALDPVSPHLSAQKTGRANNRTYEVKKSPSFQSKPLKTR